MVKEFFEERILLSDWTMNIIAVHIIPHIGTLQQSGRCTVCGGIVGKILFHTICLYVYILTIDC